jgi:hypothetical protein
MTTEDEINRGDAIYGPGFSAAVDAALAALIVRFEKRLAEEIATMRDPRFEGNP